MMFYGWSQTVLAATVSKEASTNGLVAYWSFNEGSGTIAHDFSGNGNNGTLSGTTIPVWTNGKFGKALTFDGSTSNVAFSFNATPINTIQRLTFSAWIKTSVGTGVENNVIEIGGNYNSWAIYIDSGDGGMPSLSLTGNWSTGRVKATTNVKDGKWHLVTGTFDGTTGTIYIDGNAQNSAAVTLKSQTGVLSSAIGMNIGGGDPWNGQIDEVRIYSRALSASEVSNLYNQGLAKFSNTVSMNGLLGYWTFDEGTSTLANDYSGNGYTLSGVPASGWGIGRFNNALSLSGSNRLTNANFSSPPTMTVSAWFKLPSLPGCCQWVIGKENSFVLGTNSNSFYAYIHDGTTGGSDSNGWNRVTSNVLTAGTWYHVVLTYQNRTQNIYVNGVLTAGSFSPVGDSDGNVDSGTGNLTVGDLGTRGNYFTGLIDDVRIYNRVLSATEIANLYKSAVTKTNVTPTGSQTTSNLLNGLVGYWTMDGKDTNWLTGIEYDRSGNRNNGQLVSMSTSSSPAIGKIGQAMRLDGSSGYIRVGTTNFGSNSGTVSIWVNPSTITGTTQLFAHQNGSNRLYLGVNAAPALNIGIADSGGIDVSTALVASQWQNFVLTYSSGAWVFYKNGAQQSQGSYSGTITFQGYADIGAAGNGGWTTKFAGLIDDARVYNRALSAAEVKQLYQIGK